MNPARHTRSTWWARRISTISGVEGLALLAPVVAEDGGDPRLARALETEGALDVRDHHRDLAAQLAPPRGVEERLEVRAPPAEENADLLHRAPHSQETPEPATTLPITKLVSPRRSSECSTS